MEKLQRAIRHQNKILPGNQQRKQRQETHDLEVETQGLRRRKTETGIVQMSKRKLKNGNYIEEGNPKKHRHADEGEKL